MCSSKSHSVAIEDEEEEEEESVSLNTKTTGEQAPAVRRNTAISEKERRDTGAR